jgi:hypothetical protein
VTLSWNQPVGELGLARLTMNRSGARKTFGANTIGLLLVTQVGFWPLSVVPLSSSLPVVARVYQTVVP